MITDCGFVDHITVAKETVSVLPPTFLKAIRNHFTFDLFATVLYLLVNPQCQSADNSPGGFDERSQTGLMVAQEINLRTKPRDEIQPIVKIPFRISGIIWGSNCAGAKTSEINSIPEMNASMWLPSFLKVENLLQKSLIR
jgi:hypothetical protein